MCFINCPDGLMEWVKILTKMIFHIDENIMLRSYLIITLIIFKIIIILYSLYIIYISYLFIFIFIYMHTKNMLTKTIPHDLIIMLDNEIYSAGSNLNKYNDFLWCKSHHVPQFMLAFLIICKILRISPICFHFPGNI